VKDEQASNFNVFRYFSALRGKKVDTGFPRVQHEERKK
jgi:hypothetical protein